MCRLHEPIRGALGSRLPSAGSAGSPVQREAGAQIGLSEPSTRCPERGVVEPVSRADPRELCQELSHGARVIRTSDTEKAVHLVVGDTGEQRLSPALV
jgi:hypothetical protein